VLPHAAHRALRDFRLICQYSTPATASRWGVSLLRNLPECARQRALQPADQGWTPTGASFRTATGAAVALPGAYTAGAREMYCRNVYLRTGLVMPSRGWVVDLGANRGLFSVWAAANGASSVAVEAQPGFAEEIRRLARHNGVEERVHVETAVASGVRNSGSAVGDIGNDRVWSGASHGSETRPADRSVPELLAAYGINRVGLMKLDIEGGEFAVLAADEDLTWLRQVDQLTIELHGEHGDVPGLVSRLHGHGLLVDLHDDWGGRVAPQSRYAAYAYCHR
jgi:FkbM family methyltransferase